MDWPEVYALDADTGVRIREDRHVAHEYSDGMAAEAYILESVLSCKDVSAGSDELVRRIRDWPSEYHLSASRSTLLAPFDFEGLTILEVGCGCGALTRWLGETGATVVALEGSLGRARIAAARCRGLNAVHVVCDDFRDFIPPCAFDAVLMIGVLEYAPLYFSASSPVAAALDKAGTCLVEGGDLVLAIENQLGLKYFAGCSEDHTGELFFGIEDHYRDSPRVVTYGRTELTNRLKAAGYRDLSFYYPFPDYKLPKLILTEGGVREPRLHAGRLAAGAPTRDYTWPQPHLFAEDAALQVIERNGLIEDVANSFLVLARRGFSRRPQKSPSWLAELRTTDRIRPYRTTTRFVNKEGGLNVTKTLTHEGLETPPASPVELVLPGESAYLAGAPMGQRVRQLLRSPVATVSDLAAVLEPWVICLRAAVSRSRAGAEILPGDWLDVVPWNLMEPDAGLRTVVDPDVLVPFDLEWKYRQDLTVAHVVFRGVFLLLRSARGQIRLGDGMTVADILLAVGSRLGAVRDRSELSSLSERESHLQAAIHGTDETTTLERIHLALDELVSGPGRMGLALSDRNDQIRELRTRAEVAESRVVELDVSAAEMRSQLAAVHSQLAAVQDSKSWKATAPLRRFRKGLSP